MKLNNLNKALLTVLTIVTFTTTIDAKGYKLKVCINQEQTFWNTLQDIYKDSDHGLIDVLDSSYQKSYYNLELAKVETNMRDLRERCKNITQDQIDASNAKKSAIQEKLNAITNSVYVQPKK